MLIVDSHLDLAWNAVQWNRDLRRPVAEIRASEQRITGPGRGGGTVAFPEMQQGRIVLSFATLLARSTGTPHPNLDYPTQEEAAAAARAQLRFYEELELETGDSLIRDRAQLDRLIDEWQAWERSVHESRPSASRPPPFGFVLSAEGLDPVRDPGELSEWHERGLRLAGLTHYGPGRYAGGTGTESGLTDLGREVLKEMKRLGIALDLTHCSDAAFWEALEHYDGPVLASHNNCRALVPRQRQFSDDQLRAIIERGGVIGVAFDNWMLDPDWKIGDSDPNSVKIADVIDHIDHICELAGSTRHVGIGTDLDGGFGKEQSPSDLESIADLQKLPGLLADRGYSTSDIEAILHRNWIVYLRLLWGGDETC